MVQQARHVFLLLPCLYTLNLNYRVSDAHSHVQQKQNLHPSTSCAGSGMRWQLGTPVAAMQHLRATRGIDTECFASPLNATLPHYHTAFADTDSAFGAMRSILQGGQLPLKGALQVGPPYNEHLMQLMAQRLLAALRRSTEASALRFLAWHH